MWELEVPINAPLRVLIERKLGKELGFHCETVRVEFPSPIPSELDPYLQTGSRRSVSLKDNMTVVEEHIRQFPLRETNWRIAVDGDWVLALAICQQTEQEQKAQEEIRQAKEELRHEEERLRKESNLAEWKEELGKYTQLLREELARVEEALASNDYEIVKHTFWKERLSFREDC